MIRSIPAKRRMVATSINASSMAGSLTTAASGESPASWPMDKADGHLSCWSLGSEARSDR